MSDLGLIGDFDECYESTEIKWKIPNFLSLVAEKGSYYRSPSFSFSNMNFQLCIYPAGNDKAKSGFISIFIQNVSYRSCYATCTLAIKNTNHTVIITKTCSNVKFSGLAGYPDFYEKYLLQQSDLIICCILKHCQDKQDIVNEQDVLEAKVLDVDHVRYEGLSDLSENFKTLFTNEDNCDVILKVGNTELKAHKLILMARSSVFAAMFKHDTLEKQTGIVNIPDCDPDSFHQFLEYLYCGYLEDISFDNALHLYSTSVKYDVQKLKEYCVEYLMKNLTESNVCDVIILADKYDETKLLLTTQNLFNENFNKIFLTVEWENLLKNYYRLANKFLIEMSKKSTIMVAEVSKVD